MKVSEAVSRARSVKSGDPGAIVICKTNHLIQNILRVFAVRHSDGL